MLNRTVPTIESQNQVKLLFICVGGRLKRGDGGHVYIKVTTCGQSIRREWNGLKEVRSIHQYRKPRADQAWTCDIVGTLPSFGGGKQGSRRLIRFLKR